MEILATLPNRQSPYEELLIFGSGKIHSNIPSIKTLKVVDADSKRIIGEVQYPVDDIFVLAGRVWKVVRVSSDKIYVKSEKSKKHPQQNLKVILQKVIFTISYPKIYEIKWRA